VCRRVCLVVYWRACTAVCYRASEELVLEQTVKQAASVPSSAIRRVRERMSGSVLENVMVVYLGASWELTWVHIVMQPGSVIECNWECT
jgi:hypothetical protein